MPDASARFTVCSTAAVRLRNAVSATTVVAAACAAYAIAPWNARQMREWHALGELMFSGREFLIGSAAAYAAATCAWLLLERQPVRGKSLRTCGLVWRALRQPRATLAAGLAREDRVALLATLLKAVFAPLMMMSLMAFCVSAWKNGHGLVEALAAGFGSHVAFNRWGFWFALQLILFVDVAIFTVGYLVETPRLANEIRSVDPTLVGWAAALACYPPFNTYTAKVLGTQTSDFPQFADPALHVLLNALLLALMAVYAAASVALGWKASNLTHRGIVARGPYSFVRHPAYTCKNMAWWIGAGPLVSQAFERGTASGLAALGSVAGWTLVYVLRAITEERHLRGVDGEYAAYAARVRWRFVPGLI
jgi:protein-S-isoprenylcysteine O-methyltransferase Ste14